MTTNHDDHEAFAPMPGNDPLDSLLREWHAENAARAAAQRDKLMNAIAARNAGGASATNTLTPALRASSAGALSLKGEGAKGRLREHSMGDSAHDTLTPALRASSSGALSLKGEGVRTPARRSFFARFSPAAAAVLLFAATIGLLFNTAGRRSDARADLLMLPEGGRLDAVNARGERIGPCPLKHTDVHVDVSGAFARVTLQQRYANPYADKIEAVYTFPLSHRAAVDRMTMTIGDRVVVGEVKERAAARATYEAARAAGHAAALLEQERPNIFTQSVANIEPGVEIVVEISYVELLDSRDGLFSFAFPMVVAPRYIPRGMEPGETLPTGLSLREGLNLLEPGTLTVTANGDTSQNGALTAEVIHALILDAVPIEPPAAEWWTTRYASTGRAIEWHHFEAGYRDGRREAGVLYTDGLGQINGRWFYIDTDGPAWPPKSAVMSPSTHGTGFANGTAQVPDAARITPQPVRPPTRAGHDISITVNIDTGGPGIVDLKSELHAIQQNWGGMRPDGTPSQVALSLADAATIPNQDFVLHWRQTADTITEQVFTHAGAHGGFITLILNPPARVDNTQAVPRELVFVLDTSGSMQGFPIEKAKEVMSKSIAALRPQDTFNLFTFAGDTHILWDAPQPATPDKVAEAQQFVTSREGHGGTEMMTAINAALEVKPEARQIAPGDPSPIRIVCFMTDGEVGNDMAIIDAVKQNAATTRVFSFGIGNSVNRYLLDGIAKAGRGAAEYVLLSEGADAKVASFSQRIQSPVLMDVQLTFAGDIEVVDRVPEQLPDLYDVAPVIVHARYPKGGKGSVTLRGNGGDGPYEKTLSLDLPDVQAEHDVIATLWAREKVEQLMNRDLAAAQNGTFPDELKQQVIDLGESFQIMTQYTSFVAVENLHVTIGGEPRLVPVPIELPEGQSWEGTMGEAVNKWAEDIETQEFAHGAVDLWNLVRANNSTPKQFNAPSTTGEPDPAQNTSAYYDFLTEVNLSYAYQYQETKPEAAYGIQPLDARDIPADVLARVAREVHKYKGIDASSDDTIVSAGATPSTLGLLSASNSAEGYANVVASESQARERERVRQELITASPMSPRPSIVGSGNTRTNREGGQDLYFLGRRVETVHGQEKQLFNSDESRVSGAPQPATQTGGPESTYWFDLRPTERRIATTTGQPTASTPPLTPGMPPPPNSTGVATNRFRVAGEHQPHLHGMLAGEPVLGRSHVGYIAAGRRVAAPTEQSGPDVLGVPVVGFIAPPQGGPGATVDDTLRMTPSHAPMGSKDVVSSIGLDMPNAPTSGGVGGATAFDDRDGDGVLDVTPGSGGVAVAKSNNQGSSTRLLHASLTPQETAELIAALKKDQTSTTKSSLTLNPTEGRSSQAESLALDEVIVHVATWARAGRLQAAASAVDELVKSRPDHTVARAMHEVLNCFVITDESCVRRLCELAAPSARRLTVTAERARLMARRLDERLLRLAVGDASVNAHIGDNAQAALADKPPVAPSATAGLDVTDAAVLVSVLVDAFGDGTVAALTEAGLKVESTSKPTKVVIGRVAPARLADLATCKHVRRVEAVKKR